MRLEINSTPEVIEGEHGTLGRVWIGNVDGTPVHAVVSFMVVPRGTDTRLLDRVFTPIVVPDKITPGSILPERGPAYR